MLQRTECLAVNQKIVDRSTIHKKYMFKAIKSTIFSLRTLLVLEILGLPYIKNERPILLIMDVKYLLQNLYVTSDKQKNRSVLLNFQLLFYKRAKSKLFQNFKKSENIYTYSSRFNN